MPVTCLVVGCGSRANRDNVSFYSVPAVRNNKFLKHLNELSERCRAKWIAAIKREDLTESKLKNQRICSKHFITGKPAALEDENHPDWYPTQNMGHSAEIVNKRKSNIKRKERVDKRRKINVDEENIQAVTTVNEEEDSVNQDTGTSTQTDLGMKELYLKFDQQSFASKKIKELQMKVETLPFGLQEEPTNHSKWKYYTGFEYKIVKEIIFPMVEQFITTSSITALSSFNQLLLTLVKLRLNLHFKDLAYRFKVSPTTASTYFIIVIDIMYQRLKPLITWPERTVFQMNIPACFKESFQEKTTVIIDCFEVFIEKPENYLTQQQCWSNYKHHNTIKFLIGITPQGSICYISEAWGGRTSDKQIVEFSNFCNNIKPGDVVLADRGFLIKETLGILQANLIIPAFTKGKTQLHPLHIEESRHIATVRVHIERIIGMVKNKFRILKGPIPISMLRKDNTESFNTFDKVVVVCSALINISPPIIPL